MILYCYFGKRNGDKFEKDSFVLNYRASLAYF